MLHDQPATLAGEHRGICPQPDRAGPAVAAVEGCGSGHMRERPVRRRRLFRSALWRPSIPVWGMWNDNFFILGADWISWTVLATTVLVGALVAMAGAYALGLNWAARRLEN